MCNTFLSEKNIYNDNKVKEITRKVVQHLKNFMTRCCDFNREQPFQQQQKVTLQAQALALRDPPVSGGCIDAITDDKKNMET